MLADLEAFWWVFKKCTNFGLRKIGDKWEGWVVVTTRENKPKNSLEWLYIWYPQDKRSVFHYMAEMGSGNNIRSPLDQFISTILLVTHLQGQQKYSGKADHKMNFRLCTNYILAFAQTVTHQYFVYQYNIYKMCLH